MLPLRGQLLQFIGCFFVMPWRSACAKTSVGFLRSTRQSCLGSFYWRTWVWVSFIQLELLRFLLLENMGLVPVIIQRELLRFLLLENMGLVLVHPERAA